MSLKKLSPPKGAFYTTRTDKREKHAAPTGLGVLVDIFTIGEQLMLGSQLQLLS